MMLPITENDRVALELAIEMARNQDEGRRKQIDAKLAGEPWLEVAMFAAYCCQFHALRLPPHEVPPCYIDDPNAIVDRANKTWAEFAPEAVALYGRMIALGISKYHPDPMAAIAAARGQ
jgi:hypothetical protein